MLHWRHWYIPKEISLSLSLSSYIYRLWRKAKKVESQDGGSQEAESHKSLLDNRMEELVREKMLKIGITIEVCAVWDTVCGLNKKWAKTDSLLRKEKFLLESRRLHWVASEIPRGLRNAFQALALNEESYEFLPVLWNEELDRMVLRSSSLGSEVTMEILVEVMQTLDW